MVARAINQCVLLSWMVADVPIAEVRNVGTDEVQFDPSFATMKSLVNKQPIL